jgi:hypothetical protein
MTESLILLIAILVLPVIMLLAFAGCGKVIPLEQTPSEPNKQAGQNDGKSDPQTQPKYHEIILNEPGADIAGYWRFEETSGTTAEDSDKLEPRNGEYKNLTGIARGQIRPLKGVTDNKVVEFLGTQGYVEVAYHGLLNPSSLSVDLWVKPKGTSASQVLFGSYELDSNKKMAHGFVLDLLQTPLRVRARLGNETSPPISLEANLGSGNQLDGWQHVVLTYNDSTKQLTLYVNGNIGQPAQLTAQKGYIPAVNTPLRMGAGQIEGPGPQAGDVGHYFAGYLDEVVLYRTVLSAGQVKKHFDAA